eukprot:3991222-Pleurochrysis_carterae.AAC.1
MINAEALASMKPNVRIVNCARGGIIDEEALRHALDNGQARHARTRARAHALLLSLPLFLPLSLPLSLLLSLPLSLSRARAH